MESKTVDVYFAKFDKVVFHKKALGNTVVVGVSEVVFCATIECNFFRYLNPSIRYGYSKDDFFVPGGNIRLEDDRVVSLEKYQ